MSIIFLILSSAYGNLLVFEGKKERASRCRPFLPLQDNPKSGNVISTEVKISNQRASLLRAKSITEAPQDWHSEDIKAAIRKTGVTLSDLSRAAGFCAGAAKCALLTPWPRMEAAIAARLGRAPQEIWPSRYSPDGRPMAGLHIRRRKDLAPATPARNVRKERASEQRAYA
jgi:Ner family transcriptional regulator